MEMDFVTLTQENLDREQLCCIVRTKKPHPGVERKRAWLRERIREGHVFRKLAGNDCAFIEYAPIETAWAPVEGEDYLYLYCLWVQGAPRGQGVGKALMESCLQDARAKGKAGVCMLGAEKQKAWLSDQRFAEKFGFQTVDTAGEYRLLAVRFDERPAPYFAPNAKRGTIEEKDLTIYYTDQCPFIAQRIEKLRAYCATHEIPAAFLHVETTEQAKMLPCPFNNWAVFYGGRFVTVNQLDGAGVQKLLVRS